MDATTPPDTAAPGEATGAAGGFRGGLAVSLPGSHVAGLHLSGSVFGFEELRDALLPPELRLAVNLLVETAAARRLPLRFVARPEMFTHGALADRLAERLAGATDHVALSDGASFRPLGGLRNHLFFYRRGVPEACEAMRRLVEVAPEMFQALASQINGALAFRAGGAWHRPPATLLAFRETPRAAPAQLLPLFCHLSHPARAAAAALAEDTAEEPPPLPAGPIRLVPLTEAVLADRATMRVVADRLLSATLREEPPLVLQLPLLSGGAGDIADQIVAVLRALAETGIVFPWHAAVSARWATGPLEAEQLRGARILAHPGLDFWSLGRDVWRAAAEVEAVQQGPAGAPFVRLLRDWLGASVPVRLLNPRRAHDHVAVSATL